MIVPFSIFPSPKIYLDKSTIKGAGRGVFALNEIKENEIIEICPVLVLPRVDYKPVKNTILRNYMFMWGTTTSAICFGYGSFYNHSYESNASYVKKTKAQLIEFVALRTIKVNEEITVNYNYGNSENKKPLWIKEIN